MPWNEVVVTATRKLAKYVSEYELLFMNNRDSWTSFEFDRVYLFQQIVKVYPDKSIRVVGMPKVSTTSL